MFYNACIVTTLPSTLQADINTLLPEGRHPDPLLIRPDVYVYFTKNANNSMKVTFLSTGAGYINRVGYAKYANSAPSAPYYAMPKINSAYSGHKCLVAGDTFHFGPFVADDMVIFFLDANSNTNQRFYSYFGPGVQNGADDIAKCGSPGCIHSAWAYLPKYDMTIFGFEDQMLGDADYNDVVFYLTLQGDGFYNEVHPYVNGTILVCNNNTVVTWKSFADLDCQPWGILETSAAVHSCLAYLRVPDGWAWAEDTADNRASLVTLINRWGYTDVSCFLLADVGSRTSGKGYRLTSGGNNVEACSTTPVVKWITSAGDLIAAAAVTNNTNLCYNTGCESRFVLKSLTQSVACSAITRCDPTTLGRILLAEPTSPTPDGSVTLPDTVTTFLSTSGGTTNVWSSLNLIGDDLTKPQVDVVILTDFSIAATKDDGTDSNTMTGIINSWNMAPQLFQANGLNTRFSIVNFKPSGNGDTATSTLYGNNNFALALDGLNSKNGNAFHGRSCGSGSGATRRGRLLVDAMYDVSLRPFNWRPNAYHIIWLHTTCAVDVDGRGVSSSRTLKVMQTNTGVYPIIAYANSYSSGSNPPTITGSGAPVAYSVYWSSDPTSTWAQPFRGSTGTPQRGPTLMATLAKTFQVIPQTNTAWFQGVPSSAVTAVGGVAYSNFTIRWPSGTSLSPDYYSASAQVIGRDVISYLIYFNHPPTIIDNSATISTTMTNLAFTMFVSDQDLGNQLWLTVSATPLHGTLTLINGTTVVPGVAYPLTTPNMYVYTPTSRSQTTAENILITVGDGCANAQAKMTITSLKINRPPVANDIVITMNEDQLVSGNRVLTSADFSDPDGDTVSAYITGDAVRTAQTAGLLIGQLTGISASPVYSPGTPRASALPSTLVYRLTAIPGTTPARTGFGRIVIPYVVNDGTVDSNSANIIINIEHVNHKPTLSIPSPQYMTSTNLRDINFDASAQDIDVASGDTVKLRVTASNLTDWTVAQGSFKVGQAGTFTLPGDFSALTGPSDASSGLYTFGLEWERPAPGATTAAQFTVVAVDNSEAVSDPVVVTLIMVLDNPPTWVTIPASQSGKMSGESYDALQFVASDLDAGQPQQLVFRIKNAPAYGTLDFVITGGHTAYPSSGFSVNANPNIAQLVPATTHATFSVRWTPTSNTWFGTDSFSFTVTDPTGLSADSGNVQVQLARIPTPPTSRDVSIYLTEGSTGNFNLYATSTNDAVNTPVVLQILSISTVRLQPLVFPFGTWTPIGSGNMTTGLTSGTTLTGSLEALAGVGFYSEPDSAPVATFTFRAYEQDTNLYSTVNYTGTVYIRHVNNPPSSQDFDDTVKRTQVFSRRLPANDPDNDDVESTIVAMVTSIRYTKATARMYWDSALTEPILPENINSRNLTDRSWWFVSPDEFGDGTPVATLTFQVMDQHGARSQQRTCIVRVEPNGDAPIVGQDEVTTDQEVPITIPLAFNVTFEGGRTYPSWLPVVSANPQVSIVDLPHRGKLSFVQSDGQLILLQPSDVASGPFNITALSQNALGQVSFLGDDYDWDSPYTSFHYTISDPVTGAVGTYKMTINVLHVNKRPFIEAMNFPTAFDTPVIVNESSSHVFDWRAWDVDNVPSELKTVVRFNFYTTQGFSLFTCQFVAGQWNDPERACTFDPNGEPAAVRADFAKGASKMFELYDLVDTDCPDNATLKARLGSPSRNCEAHFRLVFTPTPLASASPYVRVLLSSIDSYEAESNPITTYIHVKAVNNPPKIWAPPQVVGGAGIKNPFIRDTAQGATNGFPVSVSDVDATINSIEQLTIRVLPGSKGNLTWPASAPCTASTTEAMTWICLDRVGKNIGFAQWLGDLRFTVQSGDRANIEFEINDLGNTGDYVPSPHLTATARTTVIIVAGVAAPKGNSSTLAIAVGVAAGAGLLLLGALGFFLRNAVSPPSDDYFSAATAPISAAPQSPLYQAQNTEHMSPLYKGNA